MLLFGSLDIQYHFLSYIIGEVKHSFPGHFAALFKLGMYNQLFYCVAWSIVGLR